MDIDEERAQIRKRMGDEIRAARARRNMSREELSKASGVSASTIVRLEGGTRTVDVLQLIALCEALRVDPGEILRAAQSDN